MAELCDLYMEEGVNTKKASTLYDDGLRIRRHIKPMLGKRPVSSITSADVERLMRDIADGKTKIQRRPNAAAYKAQVTAAEGGRPAAAAEARPSYAHGRHSPGAGAAPPRASSACWAASSLSQ